MLHRPLEITSFKVGFLRFWGDSSHFPGATSEPPRPLLEYRDKNNLSIGKAWLKQALITI